MTQYQVMMILILFITNLFAIASVWASIRERLATLETTVKHLVTTIDRIQDES